MVMNKQTDWMDASQVAEVLGWSKRTVLEWLGTGKLPGAQVASTGKWGKRKWRISKSELHRWMDEKGMKRGVDYVW